MCEPYMDLYYLLDRDTRHSIASSGRGGVQGRAFRELVDEARRPPGRGLERAAVSPTVHYTSTRLSITP